MSLPELDGRGHVILLHDAGGDRTGTALMLEKLIVEAKAQGYRFTTLEPILPPEFVPQHNTSPSVADHATLCALQAVWVVPPKILGFLFWFGTGSLVIVSLLYLLLARDQRAPGATQHWPNCPYDKLPFVSVVLAAYNEEKVITRTLDVLRESDYPADKFEVVAVNDGSSDKTLEILRLRPVGPAAVVNQLNSGKSSAINNGINHADPRATVIVTMDADTLFRRNTIRMLARHFIWRHRDKEVGAVAGHVKVGNRRNIITAWQSLEYISGICVTRMAEQTIGAIGIIPGACSAWRRTALEKINGFCDDTLAEDADATIALQRLGYAVVNENRAFADTEAPETMRALAKQRKRWTYGNIQALWKYKAMLLRPKLWSAGHADAALCGDEPAAAAGVPAVHRRHGRREPDGGRLACRRDLRGIRGAHPLHHLGHRDRDRPRAPVAPVHRPDLPADLRAAAGLPALREHLPSPARNHRRLGQTGTEKQCCNRWSLRRPS